MQTNLISSKKSIKKVVIYSDYEIQITSHIYLEYLSCCKDNFLSSYTIAKLNDVEKMIKLLKRNNKRDKPRSLYDLF
jgi:hypothetical protein